MFTFLTPAFLIGLLAAAIPLIVHLSRSRRQKKMQFSTTRFFTDQFLRSYRMSRLKELLLLIFRMALCALLAMALARPIFLPKGRTFMTGHRAVVLVMDNSASMGYLEDGTSLFARTRNVAKELIDGLRPGDSASIVLASRRASGPEALFPEPTTELADVRHAIDGLDAAPLGTDLSSAVAKAEAVAKSSSAAGKEVYVLSDLQDSGWELPKEVAEKRGESDVMFFFVKLRPKNPDNLAITAVQYAAARPMVGIPFSIRPHVRSQGSLARPCEVSLWIDGQKAGQRRLDKFEAGRWAVPMFHHTFTAGGWHNGYVEVLDELMTADNRRYFAFEVMDSIKVLAVNGAPSQVARLDELYFLKAALTANTEGKSAVQVDDVTPAELATRNFDGYPVVILANVESLTAPAVEKLEAYVDRGGSLLVFLGDKTNVQFYNSTFADATRLHGGLLPGRLGDRAGDPEGKEDFAFVANVDYEHPALSAFHDPKFANLAGVTFKALWSVNAGESQVLMRANTGTPLLCEKNFGKGKVLLFASTCDRDWTSFPVRPAFLPWVHRIVAYLAQESLGRQNFYATGSRVAVPVSASQGVSQVLVKKPDGTVGHATATDDPKVPLAFSDMSQPGVYTMFSPDKPNESQTFVANLDSYESDLTYLDDVLAERDSAAKLATRQMKIESGFKELLPGRPLVTYVDDPVRVTEASLSARRGIKLWDIILFIVLIIALVEPWLANRISLLHYTSAASVPATRGKGIRAPTGLDRYVAPTKEPEVSRVG